MLRGFRQAARSLVEVCGGYVSIAHAARHSLLRGSGNVGCGYAHTCISVHLLSWDRKSKKGNTATNTWLK